jgi:hypothetical protein
MIIEKTLDIRQVKERLYEYIAAEDSDLAIKECA